MRKSISLIFLCFLLFNACDIDREPFDSKTEDEIMESEEGIQEATLGNYAILKEQADQSEGWGWADLLHRVGEYGGDNVSLSGVTTDEIYYWYNYNNIVNNGRSNNLWIVSYKAIGGINTVIANAEEGTSDEKDQLIGENYYLRGLVYFGLVNSFGRPYTDDASSPGVPLKLNPDIEDIPGRSSVKEVYEQIVKDLKKGQELMNEDKGAGFASQSAAKALLSRVYLYMDKNEEAAQYADEVINSGKYSLLATADLSDYPKKNPEDNAETIFAFERKEDSDYKGGFNTVGGYYSKIDGVGWGEMYASSSYLNLINQHPEDARKGFIDPVYLHDDNGDKIPAVYWVNDNNKYVFKRTHTQNGKLYFDDDGTEREVKTEQEDDRTRYFFEASNNEKTYVTKDYDIDERNGFPKFYVIKASGQDGVAQLWSPVMSRLAEMYLNRAEANAKMGNTQQAIDDVDRIRERAGIPTYDSESNIPDGLDVLAVVLQERRLEMAYEGWRKFDVFRNGQTLDRAYPGVHLNGSNPRQEIEPSDDRVILYIPEQQRDVQPNLEQNP